MNTTTKVFATLSLSAAVAERIRLTGETENIRGSGESLRIAGYEACGEYPSSTSSKKKVEKIVDAVGCLLSKPMEPQEILSMLIAGLTDIYSKCNPDRHDILDSVIYAAQNCLDFYPDDVDHEESYEIYQRWCGE